MTVKQAEVIERKTIKWLKVMDSDNWIHHTCLFIAQIQIPKKKDYVLY